MRFAKAITMCGIKNQWIPRDRAKTNTINSRLDMPTILSTIRHTQGRANIWCNTCCIFYACALQAIFEWPWPSFWSWYTRELSSYHSIDGQLLCQDNDWQSAPMQDVEYIEQVTLFNSYTVRSSNISLDGDPCKVQNKPSSGNKVRRYHCEGKLTTTVINTQLLNSEIPENLTWRGRLLKSIIWHGNVDIPGGSLLWMKPSAWLRAFQD